MADIRGIPTTDWLRNGRLTALAGAPAGFTVGARYYPLAVGVDCAPPQPVVYVMAADDAGVIRTVQVAWFTWAIVNQAP